MFLDCLDVTLFGLTVDPPGSLVSFFDGHFIALCSLQYASSPTDQRLFSIHLGTAQSDLTKSPLGISLPPWVFFELQIQLRLWELP